MNSDAAWLDDDDLVAATRIVQASMVVVGVAAVIGVAVIWNAVSLAAQAIQAVRRTP